MPGNRVMAVKYTHMNPVVFSCLLCLITLSVIFGIYLRIRQRRQHQSDLQESRHQEERTNCIIETEERERTRVAQELYEGIGQQLSATKINVSVLQTFMNTSSEADRVMLKKALDLLDDSVKELRLLSQSMVPHTLIKSGLVFALLELVNKKVLSEELKINLEVVGSVERFTQMREVVLFRVLQELVTNIIRHAKATEATIQIIKHETELSILVEDNGIGFSTDLALATPSCFGLRNAQSRMAYLKGTIFFDSRLGKGTTVSMELPL